MDDLGADYSKWLKADLWTIERAILLLVNAESLPSNSHYSFGGCKTKNEQIIYDDFMYFWDIAKTSLISGTLKKRNKSYSSLDSLILPSDFIQWVKLKGFLLPDELKTIDTGTQAEAVEDAGIVSHAGTETKPKVLSKLEKQQAAILEVIKAKGFKPMAIPDGEKSGAIQRTCENTYATLFKGSTSFDRAWDFGLKSGLWKMEHHESYARRGNN